MYKRCHINTLSRSTVVDRHLSRWVTLACGLTVCRYIAFPVSYPFVDAGYAHKLSFAGNID